MTNGEKIKEIFPSMIVGFITESQIGIYFVKNQHSATVFSLDWWNAEYKDPTTKNDLGVDCIDKTELLKAMDTWDKFGDDPNEGLILLSTPALQDRYVPYVKYDDMVKCVKNMSTVTSQERKGYWINKYRLFDSCSAECSSCHKRSNGYMYDNGFSLACKYYDFCPKCGAKMVEPQESEEV